MTRTRKKKQLEPWNCACGCGKKISKKETERRHLNGKGPAIVVITHLHRHQRHLDDAQNLDFTISPSQSPSPPPAPSIPPIPGSLPLATLPMTSSELSQRPPDTPPPVSLPDMEMAEAGPGYALEETIHLADESIFPADASNVLEGPTWDDDEYPELSDHESHLD